jgi:hypothetical protein
MDQGRVKALRLLEKETGKGQKMVVEVHFLNKSAQAITVIIKNKLPITPVLAP